MARKFKIIDEIIRQYTLFNTVGNQLTVQLLPPLEEDESNPISYFMDSVTDICEHVLRNCDDSDKVGISIRNEVNMKVKAIGISFRRKDHLSADVIVNVWGMLRNLLHVLTLWTLWFLKFIV